MLWEAGIVIQIPIGVLFLYPSALIMHFNIKREGQLVSGSYGCVKSDLCCFPDIQILVTPDGAPPTPSNSVPIGSRKDQERGARCSMVWFTQGSIFRSAALAFTTVEETKEREKEAQARCPRPEPYYPTTFDAPGAIAKNFFPLPQ